MTTPQGSPARYAELFRTLLARIERFSATLNPQTGRFDAEVLPEAQTLREVIELIGACPDFESNLAARAVVAWVFRSLDQIRADDQDWATTAELYRASYRADRAEVPPSVLDQVERLERSGRPPDLWANLSASVLRSASRTGDQVALGAGIRLTRRALRSAEPGSPRRITLLDNLATALGMAYLASGGEESPAQFLAAAQDAANAAPPGALPPVTAANLGKALALLADGAQDRRELHAVLDELRQRSGLVPTADHESSWPYLLSSALVGPGTRLADPPALRTASRIALSALQATTSGGILSGLLMTLVSQASCLRAALADQAADADTSAEAADGDGPDAVALLGRLRRLLSMAGRARDPLSVLNDAVITDARRLLAIAYASVSGVAVADAAAAAGNVHWLRFRALRRRTSPGALLAGLSVSLTARQGEERGDMRLSLPGDPEAETELNLAVPLFASIPADRARLIPDELRPHCRFLRTNADLMAALAVTRSISLLASYESTGEPAHARDAREKLSRALCSPYLEAERRESVRTWLGNALVCCYPADGDSAGLTTAISILEQVVAAAGQPAAPRASALTDLATAYTTSYTTGHDPAMLDAAIERAREARSVNPEDSRAVVVLATVLLLRYEAREDLSILDEAITLLRPVVAESGNTAMPELRYLAFALRARGSPDDVAEAASCLRSALNANEARDAQREDLLSELAEILAELPGHESDEQLADERVALLSELAESVGAGDRLQPSHLFALADAIAWRYDHFPRVGPLRDAAAWARDTLARSEFGFDALVTLAGRMATASEAAAVTETSIALLRSAIAAMSAGHPRLGYAHLMLSDVLTLQYDKTGEITTLQEIIACDRAVLELIPADFGDRPDVVFNTGMDLIRQFRHTGEVSTLREAVGYLGSAYEIVAADDPRSAHFLAHYTPHAVTYAEEVGEISVLPDLIAAIRVKLSGPIADAADAAELQNALAQALHHMWLSGGTSEYLDEALGMARNAAAYPGTAADRERWLSNLGFLLIDASNLREDQALVDEGIAVLRESVSIAPTGDTAGSSVNRLNLAALLHRRAQRMDDHATMQESLTVLRGTVDPSEGQPHHSIVLNLLGGTLVQEGRRDHDQPRVEEGVGFLRQSIELMPTAHVQRDRNLFNLSSALFALYEMTSDIRHLTEAIDTGEAAVSRAGLPDSFRPRYLHQLARSYWARATATRAIDDADRARELVLEAIRLAPEQSAIMAACVGELASMCAYIGIQAGTPDGLAETVRLYRLAVGIVAAPARDRARFARDCGLAAARLGDVEAASEAFGAVVDLLDLAAWHGLEPADQERLIAQFPGAACDAAAWALELGLPALAVERLDQGRAVMLSRSLTARTPFDELREAAPDLAERFTRVQAQLDRPTLDFLGSRPDGAGPEADNDRRIRLAREREDLLEQIRSLPGFRDFLRPIPFGTLRAAVSGPVVIVNTSQLRCDALIVTPGGVRSVPLPRLTKGELDTRAAYFVAAVALMEGMPTNADLSLALTGREIVLNTLGWLWESVTEPVLGAAGITGDADPMPRLWWCPTGNLSFLPLHAAGRYGRGASDNPVSALDYVISSYTPNLRALGGRSTGTGDGPSGGAAVLVAVLGDQHGDTSPDVAALPRVQEDVAAFTARFPDGLVLRDQEATAEAVLKAVSKARIAHFACHARQDFDDPSSGNIQAYDRPISIRELRERLESHGELAMLMGCETARGGHRLADETITLATALQLAGYTHAVATLWQVDDADAAAVAASIYRSVEAAPRCARPVMQGNFTARAVHAAVQELRKRYPVAPSRWAGFIHTGP